jgi:hypothetical protein
MKIFVVVYRTILAFAVCAIGIGGITLAHHTSPLLNVASSQRPARQPKPLAAENIEGGIRWSYRRAMS